MNELIKIHVMSALFVGITLFAAYGIFLEPEPSYVTNQSVSTGGLYQDKVEIKYRRTVTVVRVNSAVIGHIVHCDGGLSIDLGARPLNWDEGVYKLDSTMALPNTVRERRCHFQAILAWNARYSLIQHISPRPPLYFTVTAKGEIIDFSLEK